MFQAYMRGWRRWAAGLALVPGLSTLGADALGVLGQAAAQERPAASSRADEIKDLRRRAREAFEAEDYGLAKQLSEKARRLQEGGDDVPVERMTTSSRPAPAKPTTTDPKILLDMAKQAMAEGDLDKAQDLATQAHAHSAGVRWGLFDDTPSSILRDVQRARGKREREFADRLLTEARMLVEKPAASKAERQANLNAAEEKAKQAAALHGDYSMLDFGDRPANVISDVRKARDLERLGDRRPARVESMEYNEIPVTKRPASKSGPYGSVRQVGYEERETPVESPRSESIAKKKEAIKLMQEGRAFEIGRQFVEAKRKYIEAARLNARFERDEDTPEAVLSRLNIAAQRRISALVNEARTCIDLRDSRGAHEYLDQAEMLAKGMGLDAYSITEVRSMLKPPAPTIRNGGKPVASETGRSDVPIPIIRTGRPPATEEKPIRPAGGEDPIIGPIPPVKSGEPSNIIKPIPTAEKIGKNDVDGKFPPIPDVKSEAAATKPPMPTVSVPNPEKGQEMLAKARLELKKGDHEAARKIVVELINGPYGVKDEAMTLLKSIDVSESARKIDTARRAFENGMEAFHSHEYARALAIFEQIDGTLLPAESRKKLIQMITVASDEKKKLEVAMSGRGGQKLPASPKPVPGIPDVPPIGPTPNAKTGADNLLKQQEALAQVEFQRLRSKSLKVESEATNRFGMGETDAALQDLMNFIAEVKASPLDPSKQNLLVRPVEARMERLKILKHQTDFLTKESKERRDFRAEMTQDALNKHLNQEEVAKLMKSAHKLMDEAKYKEAYVQLQKAQTLDPDDPSVGATLKMADTMMRKLEFNNMKERQEQFNYEQGGPELWDFPKVNSKNPLRWTEDKEYRDIIMKRGPGSIGVMRSRSDKEKIIERKMSTPLSVNFKATPLEGVVSQLHAMTDINFDLDFSALKEENIDPKQPITTDLKDLSLKSALDIICRQAGLKHVIESEAIRITTPKRAAGRQIVKSLPVGDLVVPAPNYGQTPGLSLTDSLRMATENAYGISRMTGNSPRTPAGGLPAGTSTGSPSIDLPGSPNRLRNNPRDGGAASNTGPTNGTLERELIRLITSTIKPDSWVDKGGEGTIEYYPLGLAMVINQSPEVIEEVERLLESLRKLQDLEVSIEVKVVSLSETFYERIGVDFAMGIPTNAQPLGGMTVFDGINKRNFSGNVVGLQIPRVPTPDLDIPIRATSFARAVPPFGGFTNSFEEGGISLGMAFLSDLQVQMFLEAAQGDTRTNVMQAPKLTALNGTAASMTVGDFQFFLTGINVTSVNGQLVFTPNNVPFQVGITQPIPPNTSIQNGLLNFTPTTPQTPGLGLFIQPVVSADRRFVRLNIQQSFVSLVSGTQQIPITTVITPVFENGGQGQPVPFTQFLQQPRFSNLETQTVVVVPDGGTVVMGGLKWMTEGRNEFGPPVLSKIPYLNRLFKNVAYGREGRSILIMVTPRVIINREEQERQTGVREDDFIGLAVGGGL